MTTAVRNDLGIDAPLKIVMGRVSKQIGVMTACQN
jgi:hypothetical protein